MKKYVFFSLLLALFLIPANVHSKVLDLPLSIQEQDQWCWAAVSQSMLAYYGSDIQQCEIAEYTRVNADWHDFGDVHCCTDPARGCNYWNYNWGKPGSIEDILYNWNVQVNNLSRHLTEQEITSEIDSDKPFIIRWGWNTGGGHFVNGYGIEGSMVSYMDPWISEGHKTALYSWVVSGGNHEWTHTQTMRQAPVEQAEADTPSFIRVPSTNFTGNYTVLWGSSSTSGVTYVLEEATNSSFTSGRRTAYTGSNLSASITERADGIYFYRVKATKAGYEDSEWRTGSNGCTVNVESTEVTVNPVTSNIVSFGDIINVPEEITWVWLWTGKQVDERYIGSYVNTSSFNIFGEGWIEINDLDNLKLDFAQYDNTILYVLPWASGTNFDWQKFEVDFQASDQVRNSVYLDITQDTYASDVFKVKNVHYGHHWLQLWIGSYLDTSAFNSYGNGWIEASDLPRLLIQGDAFRHGESLWIRQYSQSPGSRGWVDYGWLEFKE